MEEGVPHIHLNTGKAGAEKAKREHMLCSIIDLKSHN
jgi:hypothetical protein